MGVAAYYSVAIFFPLAVTEVLTAGLLAIAAPPIPGGSLSCYTVLLARLEIPAQAVALAIAGNVILDFYDVLRDILPAVGTAAGGNRLGLSDKDRLKKEETI